MEELNNFLHSIGPYNVLTMEEEKALFQKIYDGDVTARETIINHNLKLVVSISFNLCHYPEDDIMDLISNGTFGLIEAVDKFDFNEGTKLSTFATPFIRAHILGSRTKGTIVNFPTKVYWRWVKLKTVQGQYEQLLTPEELSEKTGIELSYVKELYPYISLSSLSFDSTIVGNSSDDENKTTYENVISVNEYEDFLTQIDQRELVKEIFQKLTPVEIKFCKLYFGLDGASMTLEEIGESGMLTGKPITRQRVSQIFINVLEKIRRNPKMMAEIESVLS